MHINRCTPRFIALCGAVLASFVFSASVHAAALESWRHLGVLTPELAGSILQRVPPLDALQATYTADLYKLTYHTTAPHGEATIASGLVVIPQRGDVPVSMVVYNHGTRVLRNEVPSNFSQKDVVYPALFTNHAGYMLVMPDYLGFGESTLPLHPYVHAATLAAAGKDIILAARELAGRLEYPLDGKLFLSGYSEGGFATLVLYKSLLKDHPDIPVTAVACGSAPFGYSAILDFVLNHPGPRATTYIAYMIYAMQTWFHYWDGLDTVFAEPFDTLIPELFDGQHTGEDIIANLPNDPKRILQPGIAERFLDESDPVSAALIKNFNHYDFRSVSPMLIVGTRGDQDVPFAGAEMAYAIFRGQGDPVYLTSVSDDLDHIRATPLVLQEIIQFFALY